MKLQNGGYIWKSALLHNDDVSELLFNGSTIDPIIDHGGYETLKDVLLEYMDEEELERSSESDFLNLDRLPILSHMDGHTMLCFDYGYNVENEYESPEIVHFELECAESGYEEKLRIKSYDELINNLVYYGYESTSYYIGVKSKESIENISALIEEIMNLQLEMKTDNGYGWYNFEKWYYGEFMINKSLSAHIRVSPNQFLSKTYLFQNNKDFTYIIDVDLRIGVETFQDNSNDIRSIIEDSFKPLLSNLSSDFILVPYHKDNPEQLESLKKTFENRAASDGRKLLTKKNKSKDSGDNADLKDITNKNHKNWWERLWS